MTETTDCPICFDTMCCGEKNFIRTACGHEFHASCLMMNISSSRGFKCPFCRQKMIEAATLAPSVPAPAPPVIRPRPPTHYTIPIEVALIPLDEILRTPGAVGPYCLGEPVRRRWDERWYPYVVSRITNNSVIFMSVSDERYNTVCERCNERGHNRSQCFTDNVRSGEFERANPSICKRCGCKKGCGGAARRRGQPALVENCRSTNPRAIKYDRIHPRPINA